MATREEDLPLNKMVKRVTMYGTGESKFHKFGEETLVDPSMVSHFEKRGLSLTKPTKPAEKEEEGEKL